MKYVFNYQKFLEKFEISDSDEPDVKMAKEKMNSLQEQFTEFNQKKASIDAIYKDEKLTPDQVEEKLKQLIGLDFGSGYCSDPLTCECLDKNLPLLLKHNLVRKTWATYDNLIAKKEQKKLF